MCPLDRLLWSAMAPASPLGALGRFLEKKDDVRAGLSPNGRCVARPVFSQPKT